MKQHHWILSFFVIVGVTFSVEAMARDSIVLGFESETQWKNWQTVAFSGIRETKYRFDSENKQICARADRSASGRAVDVPTTLKAFPVLSWEWKISDTVPVGDVRSKETDDYAARVYVSFQRTREDFSFWERTKAGVYETVYGEEVPGKTLTFIWANRRQGEKIVPSPYTRHSKMIALRRGNDRAEEWVSERINIPFWFEKAFGGDPPPVHSISLMTDTDNTGSTASACYRQFRLHRGE